MDKYDDLGLEASKFIEDLNMYEASKDGLFRVDKGAGNNPEFEETRRVFATKMAKIHLQQQQQQQLLQEETLPRASRGPINGGARLGPPAHREAGGGSKLAADGAAKPLSLPQPWPLGRPSPWRLGSPSYPPQEQRAKLYVRGSRQGSQDCGSKESMVNSEMSAFHRPGPCEDPSCLTHGDYYDNLSLAGPKWADDPGVSPGIRLGVGSGWSGTPGSDPLLSKPSRDPHLYHQQLSAGSGRSLQSGQDGGPGGGNSEKPAGVWTTASSQRVSPGLPSAGPENGALPRSAQPRTPSFSAPLALNRPSQGSLPRTNSGVGSEVSGTMPKPTVDPQPWFQDGPKSYLSSSAPSSSPASMDHMQAGALLGWVPSLALQILALVPSSAPTALSIQ